jgi:23S rRNA (uridine2552-2'-O)-methyltransferase
MYLCELALEFARLCLKPGGALLVKVFQGAGFAEFLAEMRKAFVKVGSRKPEASRGRSSEMYLLGKGYKVTECKAGTAGEG